MFDKLKLASDMMKNMSPDQIKELMEKAKESQALLDDQIKKIVSAEIDKRGLISKSEVEELIRQRLNA